MGASDSKLGFKQGIFKLSEQRNIAADDPYWRAFWELPESAEDVFSLFTPADIRRARDNAQENVETLLKNTVAQLCMLRHHPSFPDAGLAPEQDVLNCCRVLTRILPYIYEVDHLHQWEDNIFWGPRKKLTRKASLTANVLFDDADAIADSETKAADDKYEDAKPLGEELIDTLLDLLFFEGFTLPAVSGGKKKVSYAIWLSGVGCNTPIGTTKECESSRSEILRLLLTLASKGMYMGANMLPVVGVKAITYIATCPNKQVVLSLLCSLLNTTVKYNPASWTVPYGQQIFKDPKQILVTYCIELLLTILVYPVPEAGPGDPQKNYYRHFLGRLHRPQDFQFIVEGMTRILNQPILANSSYLPGSHAQVKVASEMIMLFWEITQCNKRFRSFIIDTNRAHDFVILILFYALEYKLDPTRQGVVKMCAFILQTLSVEKNFGPSLNKTFENQDTLPAGIKIQGFRGTYGDFLIQSIFTLITTSKEKLTTIYPALLSVIANISGHLQHLSATTSTRLLQLFQSMSSPSFLLANDSNHDLLEALLNSLNAIIEHQYEKNPHFIYALIRSRKRFQALQEFTLESAQAEIERQNQQKKDAESRESIDSHTRTMNEDAQRDSINSHRRLETDETVFAIGDDDGDDDTEDGTGAPTPQYSTPRENASRASSVTSGVDEAVPSQLRGMSEKARGKMPAGTPTFSRQNSTLSTLSGPSINLNGHFEPSTQWLDSWLPHLPLHTILTVISELYPVVPRDGDAREALRIIKEVQPQGIDISPLRIHSFEWSPLSLGWYESLLWSFIYINEMQVSKGTVGVWNSTAIKLFRVQEAAPEGPSLTRPRGAVDAVGSNIVSRIGSMSLASRATDLVGAATRTAQQATTGRGEGGQRSVSGRSSVV